jgi:DNA-binding PadR family transcriptional regulator
MPGTNDRVTARLKKHWFDILLALADGAQHGYAIRSLVEQRTDGRVKLYPATLYGSVREMADGGLIEALEGDAGPDSDQRRRYYQLTDQGRAALRAEVDRLQSMIDAARATAALGGA